MNIVKLQRQLESVPDQALIGYVQNPDGQVPSYLALAEISRRKKVRDEYQQQAAPEQSVAETMVAEAQPQGVAGLPTNPEMFTAPETGIMAPAAAAGGEVQSYADGGAVAFKEGGLSEADKAYEEAIRNTFLDKGYRGLSNMASGLGGYLGDLSLDAAMMPGQARWVRDPKTGKLVRAYETEGWMPRSSDKAPSRVAASKSAEAMLDKAKEESDPRMQKTKEFLDKQAKENLADPAYIANVNKQNIMRDITAGKYPDAVPPGAGNPPPPGAGRPGAGNPNTGNPSAGLMSIAAPVIQYDEAGYNQALLPKRSAQEAVLDFKKMMGEDTGLAGLKERLGKMEERSKSEELQAPWMALARAGFGMAAGKSPFALQNIAEGASAGLSDYAAARDRLRNAEEKRFDIGSRIAQAERAEQLAAVKYGTESEQYNDTQNRLVKLHAMDAKNNAKIHDASNQLTAQRNAIEQQQGAWTHEYQMGSLANQRTAASKLSDYETSLAMAQKDPSYYKTIKGADGKEQRIFDVAKFNQDYRGYDTRARGQDLQALQKQYAAEIDPKKRELIGQQIQSILSGGDPSAISSVPGIAAPRADLFKPVK